MSVKVALVLLLALCGTAAAGSPDFTEEILQRRLSDLRQPGQRPVGFERPGGFVRLPGVRSRIAAGADRSGAPAVAAGRAARLRPLRAAHAAAAAAGHH